MLSWSQGADRSPDPIHLEVLRGVFTIGASVAHDIRNPLTVFKALRYSLTRDGQARSVEQLARDAEVIVQELERVERTLEAFLSFVDGGLAPEPIARTVEAWRLLVEKRLLAVGVELHVSPFHGEVESSFGVGLNPRALRALLLAVSRVALGSLGTGGILRVSVHQEGVPFVEFRGDQGASEAGRSSEADAASTLESVAEWAAELGMSLRATTDTAGWGVHVLLPRESEAGRQAQ